MNPSLQRQAQEAWTIEPVNDPRKLELMRCAYQRVVLSCRPFIHRNCPDCDKRFRTFYTGSSKGDLTKAGESGITTVECFAEYCWFNVGCKQCVTKDCCDYVGEYCGVHVWVPAESRDELTKLTLTILDFATNEPKKIVQNLKEVTWYLDEDGHPTDGPYAARVVATVDVKDHIEAILDAPKEGYKGVLDEVLRANGVSRVDFRTLGPFAVNNGQLPTNVKIQLVQLLANLGQRVAKDLIEFADDRGLSLKEVAETKNGAALGLTDEDRVRLVALKERFRQSDVNDYQGAIAEKSGMHVDTLPERLRTPGAGLESLDLSPGRALSPITLPSQRTPSGANDILQLRQQLDTITPPPLIAP